MIKSFLIIIVDFSSLLMIKAHFSLLKVLEVYLDHLIFFYLESEMNFKLIETFDCSENFKNLVSHAFHLIIFEFSFLTCLIFFLLFYLRIIDHSFFAKVNFCCLIFKTKDSNNFNYNL